MHDKLLAPWVETVRGDVETVEELQPCFAEIHQQIERFTQKIKEKGNTLETLCRWLSTALISALP